MRLNLFLKLFFPIAAVFIIFGLAVYLISEEKEKILLVIFGGLLVLSAVVFFVLNFFVTKPIELIKKAISGIGFKGSRQKVDIKTDDEIGFLAKFFNQALDNIERSREKTKEEHEETKAIISSMGEGLLVLDTDLKIVLMNKTAERLLNVKLDDFLGSRVTKVLKLLKGNKEIPLEDYPANRMLMTGKAVTVSIKDDIYYKALFGRTFPVEIVTAPFRRKGIVGAVVVFKDITETKKIEEERDYSRINLENALQSVYIERDIVREQKNKLEAILNSIGDAVFAVDKEKKVIIFNFAAEKITGFSRKDLIGRDYKEHLKFTDEKTKEEKNEFIDSALEGKTIEMDNHTVFLTKDNNLISIEQSTAPIRNSKNEAIGCIVVFRDVTAKREVERMRSDFISIASHQLRTPLSGIKWFLEILLNGDVGALNSKQAGILKETYTNNQNMINLVNKMLDMSRLESNRFAVNLERINLNCTVKAVLKEIKPFLNKKKQEFNFEPFEDKDLVINADKILIKNIIHNLIINASKYTPVGGKIVFSITKKDEHYLLFKMSDNGIGIPEKEKYKIFNKFFRATNAIVYDAGGTGLGLYIVKSILDIVGGKIWFESVENKGTDFYFMLPMDISWCRIK